MSYLAGLTLRLAAGAMQFDDDFRRRQIAYLAAAQQEDGGFPGREGPADLYYTGFGLRGLALLDALSGPAAARAADFLRARLADTSPGIDFLSLAFSAVLLEAVAGIDVFAAAGLDRREACCRAPSLCGARTAATPRPTSAARSSTYQTFLVIACRQLVGIPIEDGDRIAAMIRSSGSAGTAVSWSWSGCLRAAPIPPRRRSACCASWGPWTSPPRPPRRDSWPECRGPKGAFGPTPGFPWPIC